MWSLQSSDNLIGTCRVSRITTWDNLIGACRGSRVKCRGSRVNCRGFRKLSRIRKFELFLFPTFPKTITIASKLADNEFLNFSFLLFARRREQNTFLQLDKQRTHEIRTHRSLKFEISLQYCKANYYISKLLLWRLSVLILSGGFKSVQCGILFMYICFGQK